MVEKLLISPRIKNLAVEWLMGTITAESLNRFVGNIAGLGLSLIAISHHIETFENSRPSVAKLVILDQMARKRKRSGNGRKVSCLSVINDFGSHYEP